MRALLVLVIGALVLVPGRVFASDCAVTYDSQVANLPLGGTRIVTDPSGSHVYFTGSLAPFPGTSIGKYSVDGFLVTKWPLPVGAAPSAGGLAVDGSGNVYATNAALAWPDSGQGVQKFSPDGVYLGGWGPRGSGDDELLQPFAIAVDSDGDVYVSDRDAAQSIASVKKFTSDGTFLVEFGSWGTGSGQFTDVKDLGVGPGDVIFVGDGGNRRVSRFASDGTFQTSWGTVGTQDCQFFGMNGLGVAPDGSVHLPVGSSAFRISKFTGDGTCECSWGTQGGAPGELNFAQDIAFGPGGAVCYVVESSVNHRIQRFEHSSPVSVQAESWGRDKGRYR